MDIIYKLKQKPEPVQQKEVKITYNIVDETTSGFDRNKFKQGLKDISIDNKSKKLPADMDDIDYVKESEYKLDNRIEIIKQFLQSKSLSYFKQLEKVSKAEILLQIQNDTRQTSTNIKDKIYDLFIEIKNIKESDQKIEPLNNIWDEMSDSSDESDEDSDEENKKIQEKEKMIKPIDELSSDEDESSDDEDKPNKKKKNKAVVQGKYVKHSKILRYVKQYLYFIGSDIINMEIDDIIKRIEKELDMEMDDSIRKKIIELITEHNESKYYELFKPTIDPPSYYLNNRGQFIDFINKTFEHYKEKILEDEHKQSCSSLNIGDFSLLSHQQIVKDYLNLYSPYRGLLLFHGLGSGKTCASIGIAEGLKSDKQVIIMTPAALEVNYVQELKKCGDEIYKYNKHWELVPYSDGLAKLNSIPKSYTKAQTIGIWMENPDLPPNFKNLKGEQQKQINDQIEIIIKQKYIFMHYDGLRKLPSGVFNNKIVIIDEAHNVSSKIASKLRQKNQKETISMQIYNELLSAENCRVILLSGTPIINYPNEIAVLYNMIRGYMKTWYFNLNVESSEKIDRKSLLELLLNDEHIGATLDYMDYTPSSKILTFTRIPTGFMNLRTNAVKYTGEYMNETEYIKHMKDILNSNQIKVVKVDSKNHKALIDSFDEFMDKFYKYDKISESSLLKRRITGLTSYFPDIERLLPKYSGKMNMVYCEMSDYQYSIYQELRNIEIKKDKNIKKRKKLGIKSIYDVSSTYRTFTRAACNFVFPKEVPRPVKDIEVNEEDIDDDDDDDDNVKEINIDVETIKKLNNPKFLHRDNLGEYSPKYLEILKHIEKYDSLQLFYSNFKKYEGVGIFKLVLLNNGYTEFKLKRVNKEWHVDVDPDDTNPKFVLHTGSVTEDEKKIIRDVFNGKWEALPDNVKKYVSKYKNNFYGEVIKLLMITKSGVEGISLSNVQDVHICEPHWHPVRIEQAIGRARRICSHTSLPKEDQVVRVNMYISKFSDETIEKMNTTIKLNDTNEQGKIISTDEYMYGIMSRKEKMSKQMLETIKSSAIDCEIHNKQSQCMSLVKPYTYTPSIMDDELEKESELNIKQVETKYISVKLNGKPYVVSSEYKHNEEYDYIYKEIYEQDDYDKNKKTPEKLKVVGEIIKSGEKEKVKMYKK